MQSHHASNSYYSNLIPLDLLAVRHGLTAKELHQVAEQYRLHISNTKLHGRTIHKRDERMWDRRCEEWKAANLRRAS